MSQAEMAICVQILKSEDAAILLRVAGDVFDGPVQPELAEEFLRDPRHHIAVALDEAGTVIGMATGVHYVHHDKAAQLFVNEVGVSPQYQNQGVGQRLLEALLAHGRSLGCVEMWVTTESDNAAARALYRKCGGIESPEQIVMYTFH